MLLHSTGILRHHWLAQFAAKRLSKLWHILYDTVHQKFLGRVRTRLHQKPELLGHCALAPILTVPEEKLLDRGESEFPIYTSVSRIVRFFHTGDNEYGISTGSAS